MPGPSVISMRSRALRIGGFAAAVAGALLLAGALVGAEGSPTGGNSPSQEEIRTWSTRSGSFRVQGVLVRTWRGNVVLKKADGTLAMMPVERLCDDDRRYVESFMGGARGEEIPPPPRPGYSGPADGEATAQSGDESARTEAREDAPAQPRARSSYRTSARSAARTTAVSAGDQGSRRVVVDGVGATPDEALKDAFRQAVAEVMGSIIDAETEVDNDRLMRDRVLTFTDGFVESFEDIETARREDGLVRRRIAATVGREGLLLACGKTSMSLDAGGLYPEAMTKLERRKNAEALLRRTLDALPGGLLQVELAGRPRVVEPAEKQTLLAPELVIRVNARKYDALQDRMCTILRCLSRCNGTVSGITPTLPRAWQGEAARALRRTFLGGGPAPVSARDVDLASASISVDDVDFGVIQALMLKRIPELSSEPPYRAPPARFGRRPRRGASAPSPPTYRAPTAATLVLIKRQSDWRWFELDSATELPSFTSKATVTFRNDDGGEVATARLALGPWTPNVGTVPDAYARGNVRTLFISPWFLCYSGEGYNIPKILVARSLTVRGRLALENDQLSQVKTIEAGVVSEH